ncbi:MAG: cation tolerance protein CutA [Verrucomicrobia bacterium RIFCSPLOWO2_12_FULL_64_8]|nr:MAG: cation tolerance protein CutA [Verrucomicrobia bacterium RIFCSPLOWO2_12_FULL_64_8]
MLIAWTTVATARDAARLARGAIQARLAACVQIDGPMVSFYRWKDRVEQAVEHRLTFKLLPKNAVALEAWVRAHHPYDTSEWVVLRATRVSEKYLSWAKTASTPAPSKKA